MERWREKASEMFPELASSIETADSPYLLWFELRGIFEGAYDKVPRAPQRSTSQLCNSNARSKFNPSDPWLVPDLRTYASTA